MSQREFMIVVAHTHVCTMCRGRLLSDPEATLSGRPLSEDEKARLAALTFENYITPDTLARATGITQADLDEYRDQGVVRLRHI